MRRESERETAKAEWDWLGKIKLNGELRRKVREGANTVRNKLWWCKSRKDRQRNNSPSARAFSIAAYPWRGLEPSPADIGPERVNQLITAPTLRDKQPFTPTKRQLNTREKKLSFHRLSFSLSTSRPLCLNISSFHPSLKNPASNPVASLLSSSFRTLVGWVSPDGLRALHPWGVNLSVTAPPPSYCSQCLSPRTQQHRNWRGPN